MTPKPFSISMQEARHMMMENSLDIWATDEFAKQGLDKSYYLIMFHDKQNEIITFYPIKMTWWLRIKMKVLDLLGIKYGYGFVNK